jgi:primosomal protein N' (replication factor Y) (superfamily II helicase)
MFASPHDKVAAMTAALRIARVAVPAPIRRLFDYFVPPHQPLPRPGARVRVPFGARRTTIGVVVALADSSDVPRARLKAIVQALDAEPLLSESSLSLLHWASQYYHHPIGEVIATALPGQLRRRENVVGGVKCWTSTAAGMAADPDQLKRAPVQRRILDALRAAPQGLEAHELSALSRRWRAAVDTLVARGLLDVGERGSPTPPRREPVALLTEAQQEAVDAITAASGFRAFLLYGVTGSGKTEVYLRTIAAAMERGDQALMLVPEIGLTPQLAARLQEGLGVPIAVLHSGLNDQARAAAWLQAALGKVQLVVGTRSAVFTPLPRLGVIVVDEEHDASYKQQDGFRYSARDVAVMRASRESIPIVLGSATPSLESLNHARDDTYRRLVLPARAGGAELPTIELLDMRRLAVDEGLSHPLRAMLASTLQKGEQALLFLNRRGFAPVWMCFSCGWVAPCERCDARLTFHRASARLRCHHCGAERAPIDTCPNCRQSGLHALGQGTERVEAALVRQFPHARIIRIDRDSTRPKGALEGKLERIRAGTADILIGTQMLSKGHDFPNVTLVGVLQADQGLYGGDFRADERLAQQIIQVSGRAGRAAKPGRVLVQTYHPDHPVFVALCRHDYDAFADYALAERRAAGLPPFGYLALLRAESPTPKAALKFLNAARALIFRFPLDSAVQIMQPVPSPMERRAGRYRAQLLIRAARRAPLHALLDRWVERLSETKQARRVRWSLDVDPVDLY